MLSNKVSEIMTADIVTAPASSTIFAVMEMMAEKKVGRVVIIENQLPAGIFTEQDILKRVMNRKLDPKKIAIKQVMTSPIRAVGSDTRIVEALGKMYQGKFRHLLVTGEKKTMVGLVSMRRILKIAVELGRGLPETQAIGSIMSTKVTTVDASQSIYETIGTMVKEKTGCVIVLTNGEPSGIFTERDILKRVAIKDIDTQKTPIREVITAPLVTLAHSALVGEALAEMYRRGFRHLLIRGDREKLAGIVSMWDVLKYARALDIDESVRRTWKEIKEYWDSEQHYTPG